MSRDVLHWLCLKHENVHWEPHPAEPLRSLASLPEDLYCHVVFRVFLLASPSDLQTLFLVSKTWNAVGHVAPFALRPNTFLPLALRRNFPKVRSLDLSSACDVCDERLPCLVGLENLVTVKLKRCREVTDAGLEHLRPLTQLRSLNVARCHRIMDEGIALLCKHLSQLRHLNVKYCYALTTDGLSELTSLKNLTSLNCSGCIRLRFEVLSILSRVKSLKILKLNRCPSAIANGIDPLFSLPALQVLQLKTDNYQVPNTDSLLQGVAVHLPWLQRLDLTVESSASDVGFEALLALEQLTFLHLVGERLIAKRIFHFAAKLPSLRTFKLFDEDDGDSVLISLRGLSHLRSLAIKRTQDQGPIQPEACLEGLSDLTQLTHLILWNTLSLTGSHLSRLSALQELHLHDCPLLEVENMGGFKQLQKIRVLKFESCHRLDDRIVDVLLWLPVLEELFFSSCPLIRGWGFGNLSQLPELATVGFQFSPGLTEAVLKQLTLVASLRRLELVLCPQITEDGCRVLLNGRLKNLEYLTIAGAQSPKLDTEDFQNKLPKFKRLFRNYVNV